MRSDCFSSLDLSLRERWSARLLHLRRVRAQSCAGNGHLHLGERERQGLTVLLWARDPGRSLGEDRGRDGDNTVTRKGTPWEVKEPGTASLLQPSEGTGSADALTLDFSPPSCER